MLWDKLTAGSPVKQLKSTPYITGFTAGWKTFALLNLHLHPGSSASDIAFRREEVTLLLRALDEKRRRKRLWSDNLILVGDFNFYKGALKDDPTVQLITAAGYGEVGSLTGIDTNASGSEVYDRSFLYMNKYFTLAQNAAGGDSGGAFNPFNYVFKSSEETVYAPYLQVHYTGSGNISDPVKQRSYFTNPWRKNQLSDHFPVWCELITDSSPVFLEMKLQSYADLS